MWGFGIMDWIDEEGVTYGIVYDRWVLWMGCESSLLCLGFYSMLC